MASAANRQPPMLVSVKAVDPKKYPFYGEIRLSPPPRSAQALTADTVAVSDDVLLRLNLKVGDTSATGRPIVPHRRRSDLRAGSHAGQPERRPARDDHARRPGAHRIDAAGQPRGAERFLFRLSPGSPNIEQTRARLKAAFPDALIADYRESHPIVTQGLNRATTFLSLVSLITLDHRRHRRGTAMRAHIQQRMDSIAIMKCIGARSSHVMRIYLLQTIALGLAGGLARRGARTWWSSAPSRRFSRAISSWSPPRIGTF
jgi:putative ABC transport system permease protein